VNHQEFLIFHFRASAKSATYGFCAEIALQRRNRDAIDVEIVFDAMRLRPQLRVQSRGLHAAEGRLRCGRDTIIDADDARARSFGHSMRDRDHPSMVYGDAAKRHGVSFASRTASAPSRNKSDATEPNVFSRIIEHPGLHSVWYHGLKTSSFKPSTVTVSLLQFSRKAQPATAIR
jgi:hypothetical protein